MEQKYLTLTVDLLAEKFDEYNKLYFGGKLPKPSFGFHRSFKVYGYFKCNFHAPGSRIINPLISISEYYDFDDESLRDILVHEMIHFKLERRKKPCGMGHGPEFMEEAKRLNETYGLHIEPNPYFENARIKETAPKFSLGRLIWGW